MHDDQELVNLIKDADLLTPRKEFVLDTEKHLKKSARKLRGERVSKKLSIVFRGIVICAITLFFMLNILSNDEMEKGQSNVLPSADSNDTYSSKPLILLHHTHNYESFYPVTNSEKAFDSKKNVSLLGERLSKKLVENNINNVQDKSDIFKLLEEKELRFDDAYSVSRNILEKRLEDYKSIQMILDIHRDSAGRNTTTATINGKKYGRIVFVVSRTSRNYKENKKFANELHTLMEKKYPGLSKGIIVKNNGARQKTYNLDLLAQSVLLNIGGVENTLEEEYRSVDILAEVVKELVNNSPYKK